MILRIVKAGYVLMNVLLLVSISLGWGKREASNTITVEKLKELDFGEIVAGVRILLPVYLHYGNPIISHLNYDRQLELTSFWMAVLVPWDIILAVSGIHSILRNDREQIFENAFKLSVFGLVIIWMMNGLGDRFAITAPYTMKCRMKEYNTDPRAKLAVDTIQSRFKCCGFNNLFTWNARTGIPISCCPENVCTIANVYGRGCAHPLKEYAETLNLWLLFANFPFLELLVSLCNCVLTDRLPTANVIYELGEVDRDISDGRAAGVPHQQATADTSKETTAAAVNRVVAHTEQEAQDERQHGPGLPM